MIQDILTSMTSMKHSEGSQVNEAYSTSLLVLGPSGAGEYIHQP